jgi:flagellar basal-body rod modification protein FlgD
MTPAQLITGADKVGPADTTGPKGSQKLGKDEFLKLLMAQLGNQDPTAPTDSQAFVAQLAHFVSLELQQNANSNLEKILIAQASQNQTAMANFVGRDVVFKSDTIQLPDGGSAVAGAHISAPAKNVTAVVVDSNGKSVRTMQLGPHQAGSMTVTWDGRDDAGRRLEAGEYKLRVTAQDEKTKSVAVEQRGSGHVTGLAYVDGVAMLKLGEMRVKVSDIVEVNERKQP